MRTPLVYGKVVAHLKHIGVVPVTRTVVFAPRLIVADLLDYGVTAEFAVEVGRIVERSADVAASAPHMAHILAPLPGLGEAPLADAEQDGPSSLKQGVAHQRIRLLRVEVGSVAPVIFQIVHTPLRILSGILIFVTGRTKHIGAGLVARIGVNAKLQSALVHIVGQRLYAAGEFLGMAHRRAVGIAAGGVPAVIQIHINISGIAQPGRD